MGDKEEFLEVLFKVGALIGGAWLLAEIIKALSKRVYRCPNCGYIIQEHVDYCPWCKVKLVWKI